MGWLTAFLFLYAVLFIFERKRMELDAYLIAVVAIVPAVIVGIRMLVTMLVALPTWVNVSVELATYPITFLLLWKLLGLSVGRSLVYSVGLFVFQTALGVTVFLAFIQQ